MSKRSARGPNNTTKGKLVKQQLRSEAYTVAVMESALSTHLTLVYGMDAQNLGLILQDFVTKVVEAAKKNRTCDTSSPSLESLSPPTESSGTSEKPADITRN